MVIRHTGEKVMALRRTVCSVGPLLALKFDVALFLFLRHSLEQTAQPIPGRVLSTQRDENKFHAHLAKFCEADGIRIVVPLERRRPVESETRLRKSFLDFGRECLERFAVGSWKLAPQQIGNSGIEITKTTFDSEVHVAHRFGSIARAEAVGPRNDDEIGIAAIIGNIARHAKLSDHLLYGYQCLASDVAASLGKNLILDVRRGHAGIDVELSGPLHVEDVSIATVHIDDDRRDVLMSWWSAFFRIPDRHGELKLSQGADRAPRRIRNFDAGVHVHVRGSEMSDRE